MQKTIPQKQGLDAPIGSLTGIGPKRSEMLAAAGIHRVGDLREYLPFRSEDRTQFRSIRSLREEEWVLIRGEVCRVGGFSNRRRGFSLFEILLRDGSGCVKVKFFNQPYLRRIYQPGVRLVLYGQVKRDS